MAEPPSVALLGAECTGKSQLAQALAQALRQRGQRRVTVVDEWLRHWCAQAGRTPMAHEQRDIAAEQQRRIEQARAAHRLVICDTTPLMTAVYSQHYFSDDSLLPWATALQRGHALTLLLAPDLPWQADGLQRDGEAVRAAVDAQLRRVLPAWRLPFTPVAGTGEARLDAALAALARAGLA